MSKSMKALVLAGVLSIAAASAAQAGGKPTGMDFHASAAPACDTDRCPVLATDGPGSPGDNNGRSMAGATPRSGQVPTLWRPVLAGNGGPSNAGDNNGRTAALSQGGGEFRVAGGRSGLSGDV
jgi:hypothetical protein